MGFNILGGMQALANFGTGAIQENRNEQQDAYNKGATQSAQLDLQQKQLQAQQAQAASDDAIKTSIQEQQQAPKPGQPPQQAQSQQVDPMQQLQTLAQHAMARGDLVTAGQLQAQAANLATAQAARQQKQAAMQSANLKSSIQGIQYVSQLFGGVTDQATYSQARMQAISNPNLPEEERQNLAKLPDQYNPALVSHLVNSGMSAAQSKAQQLRQMEFQQRQQQDAVRNNLEEQRVKLAAQRTAATIAHQETQKKVGATAAKPVTTMDLAQAQSAIKENLFKGQEVPPEDKELVNRMTQDVAAASKQILAQHPGMDSATAMYQAIQQVKDTGQFQQVTTVTPGLFHNSTTTSSSYHAKGISKDNPIELGKNASPGDIQEGRYYKIGGKLYQDVGGKPVLVQ